MAAEVTIHQIRVGNLKIVITTAFVWYLGGIMFFLLCADFDSNALDVKLYWLWAQGKDPLFIYTIYLLSPKYRNEIYPILFFSLIRFLWEIVAQTATQDVNSIVIVDYLFYLTLFITVMRLFKRLRNEWKKL